MDSGPPLSNVLDVENKVQVGPGGQIGSESPGGAQ